MRINSCVFPETDSLVFAISVKEAKNNSKNLAKLSGYVVVINPDLCSRQVQYY